MFLKLFFFSPKRPEMKNCSVYANSVHANDVHANSVHANGVHANDVHANGVHANSLPAELLMYLGRYSSGVIPNWCS